MEGYKKYRRTCGAGAHYDNKGRAVKAPAANHLFIDQERNVYRWYCGHHYAEHATALQWRLAQQKERERATQRNGSAEESGQGRASAGQEASARLDAARARGATERDPLDEPWR